MIQVFLALTFIALCGLAFVRGRRRWQQLQLLRESSKKLDQELPSLVRRVAHQYEAKFGRAPSILEGFEGVKHQ